LHYISQFVKDKSSRKPNWVLSETNEFKITQIVDNAQMVQLTLIENVTTEPVSQKQLIIENVSKKLDSETKEQVMPLLEAILQAQPTINIKTYQQTQITITMPKSRYNNMGRPQVGNIIEVDLKKI
jgi:phage-related protein